MSVQAFETIETTVFLMPRYNPSSTLISCMLDNEHRHENCVTCTLRDTFMQTRQWSRSIFPSNLYSLLKKGHGDLLNGELQDAHNFLLILLNSANASHHNDSSIASKFLSRIKSTTICEECGNTCSQSVGYFSIPIDIIETAHIDHALRTFFEIERVNKFCEKCKRNVTAVKQFNLTRAPIVLCLQIKRFSIGSKIEDWVEIRHDLTVSKKMQPEGSSDIEYKLKAIICHTGSLNTGHYKTIVCANEKLYEFNDALVKPIPVMNIIKSKEAYVLFYELQNQKEILPQSEDISNAECNKHMANEAILSDPGSDHQTAKSDKDALNAECNIHMANGLSIMDESNLVETIDVDEDDNESDTMTDTSNAKRSQHMANECTTTNGWKQVQITDIDGEDNMLEWLNGLITDAGSDNLPQGSNENENQLSGRRIIDMQYFFDQLERCANIICKSCRTGAMSLIKESRMGLASSFILSCANCGKTKRLLSDQKNKKNQSKPNEAAALGIVSVGLGFNHLEEFCTILNIPCMSYKTYHRMDKKLQHDWWTLSKNLQEDALNEEIRLAKELNEVDSAGNALIPVKADGSWHTRSYGSNFTSLAGCAAIIGVRLNKIMYMDIKSKYCHVCKIAEANCIPPNIHECSANYDGPSSGMETAIIVEGFKYCETKGARFNKFIGDGDSNTYKTLRDLRLYKNPIVYIEKFDCLNHLHKNFGKKYIVLCKSKKTNPAARKIGENISKGVRMAAKHWKETNLNAEEKCNHLQKDCMNAPLHCFGVHDNCAEYFCTKSTTPQAREFVIALKNHGLYLPVLNLCQHYFANKVKSLLAGYDSNAAEGYNSLIAKYTGGKRVFNALAGSYKADRLKQQCNTTAKATQFHLFKNSNMTTHLERV